MNVAFGMKAHSGWAALVVLGTRSGELQVGVTETAQHANAAGAPIVSCDHVAVARGSFVALDHFVSKAADISAHAGLVPIIWSAGAGADVMKRIAAPMIGGIFTSFVLELVVYPAIYEIWKWHFWLKRELALT